MLVKNIVNISALLFLVLSSGHLNAFTLFSNTKYDHALVDIRKSIDNIKQENIAIKSSFSMSFDNLQKEIDTLKLKIKDLRVLIENNKIEIGKHNINIMEFKSDIEARLSLMENIISKLNSNFSKNNELSFIGKSKSEVNNNSSSFNHAFSLYKAQSYTSAILAFKAFIDANNTDKLAVNAYYWLGRSLSANNQSKAAIDTFDEIVRRWPSSSFASDALFEAIKEDDLLNNNRGKLERINFLLKNYPNSYAAKNIGSIK